MKCLIVSAFFPLSKSDPRRAFIRDEACELVKMGVELRVGRWIHIHQMIQAKSRVVDGLPVNDIKFDLANFLVSLPSLSELPWSYFSKLRETGILLSYSKGVEKLVRKHNIDVVHAHFAYPEGFVGVLAKKRTGRPLLVTLHGYDVLVEPSVNYGCRLDPGVDQIVRKVLRDADRVIAASSATYDAALKLGCTHEKLVSVPNAVDLTRFNPNIDKSLAREKLGLGKAPIIFTLGTHEPQKGIEYLIKAVPQVLKEAPNAMFVIGGDGSLRSYHESLTRQLGVTGNVLFTGRIAREIVQHFYAACDVFVLPSIIEAFGIVLVEAMACGKPIIGTNVGGIPDTVTDGLNGFLVNPRDSRGLAEKIVLLLTNSELREKMGNAGRDIAEKKFNIAEKAAKIAKLYASLK